MSDPIPPTLRPQFETALTQITFSTSPWLPFPWPVQISAWGMAYGDPQAPEIEWARGLLSAQLSQQPSHPPIPLARPQDPSHPDPLTLGFCWSLNRIVQAPRLDLCLQDLGYSPAQSQTLAFEQVIAHHTSMADVIKVLLCLELIYRQISPQHQAQLRSACGEDVMKAAYQLNMMCIDPEDEDRTLLQLQRIGLKLCQAEEDQVRAAMQLQLSDGRLV